MQNKKSGKSGRFGAIMLLVLVILINALFFGLFIFSAVKGSMLIVASGLIFMLSLIITFGIYVGSYNRLVSYKNKVAESLSLVDIHLKMRFDLVPNLVSCVKGYMKHEEELLEKITSLRTLALKTADEGKKIENANELLADLKQVVIAVENYPELKADKLFVNLMDDLNMIENKICASRRFYNSNINAYNNLIEAFPSNFVASLFGFEKEQFFEINVEERLVSKIDFEK